MNAALWAGSGLFPVGAVGFNFCEGEWSSVVLLVVLLWEEGHGAAPLLVYPGWSHCPLHPKDADCTQHLLIQPHHFQVLSLILSPTCDHGKWGLELDGL